MEKWYPVVSPAPVSLRDGPQPPPQSLGANVANEANEACQRGSWTVDGQLRGFS